MNQQLSVTALNDAALGWQFKSEWFWLTNRHDCIQNGRPTNRHKIATARWRQKEVMTADVNLCHFKLIARLWKHYYLYYQGNYRNQRLSISLNYLQFVSS